MSIQDQIKQYINSLPASKSADIETLHQQILQWKPQSKLWFLDGKDENGKVVSNPNIGYGLQTMHYANGKTREFYQLGLSANTTGISVYIMGLEDKTYLNKTYGKVIGKASITGYCIKFKSLEDIQLKVLFTAMKEALQKK